MEFPRKLAAARQCSSLPKATWVRPLFEYRSSTSPVPLHRHMHITRILCLRLWLFSSSLSLPLFPLSFPVSLEWRARYRSLTARKIVSRDFGQKYALRTHLSVRLHLSVRCRSQDDGGISPSDRTDDWKYSVAGFSYWRILKSSPHRRCSIAPPGIA